MKSIDPAMSQPLLPLRAEAENDSTRSAQADIPDRSAESFLHELQARQIELEMQNQALRETQIELQRSRDQYATRYAELYEFAQVGYVTVDENQLMIEANLASALMLKIERSQLLNHRFDSIVANQDRGRWQQFFNRIQRDGGRHVIDLELSVSNGLTTLAHLDCQHLGDDDCAHNTRIAITDINERRAMEEQLRKLSLAVEQSPESIMITDLEAKIEYVNDAFLRTTGYSREEVTGRNAKILRSGKTSSDTYRALWQALTKGESWKGELYNKRKDGGEYVEFAIMVPIRQQNGRITHYVAVKEDITERKRLEQELDQYRHHLENLVESRTRELEEAKRAAEIASRFKSEFLANMSHEIRTPMNAIIGLTHLASKNPSDEKQKDQLKKVSFAARHLLQILNDILDLSKIESGKLTIASEEFSVSDLVGNTLTLIKDSAEAKGLTLITEIDSGLTGQLVGDPLRISQIFVNFASNAVKFTPGGSITFRALKVFEDTDSLILRGEVTDSGIGIAPEAMGRLFGAFEQADTSATRRYGGTGLGLAISRGLAEAMGGSAGASSILGKGSTFWFTVRLRRASSVSEVLISELISETAAEFLIRNRYPNARVLLVEDDAINQAVAEEVLNDAGLNVTIATNGQEAVQFAMVDHFDLILMDMHMPVMDGLEASAAIRKLPNHVNTPILAMTAASFEEDRARCISAGMNDHISKPVDPPVLYKTLLKWLSFQGRAE